MPVIGRLDGQVEKVLIKPIGQRPARGGSGEGDAPDTRPSPPDDSPRESLPERARDERRDERELPVWLL